MKQKTGEKVAIRPGKKVPRPKKKEGKGGETEDYSLEPSELNEEDYNSESVDRNQPFVTLQFFF